MSCKDVNKLTAAFLDGELAEKEREIVKEHLIRCRRCMTNLGTVDSIQANLRNTFRNETAQYSPSIWGQERIQRYVEVQKRYSMTGMGVKNTVFAPLWLNGKTRSIGIIVIIVTILLITTIPIYLNQHVPVFAEVIALNNIEIIKALGSDKPIGVKVLDTFNDPNNKLVLIEVRSGMFITANVDMTNQTVVSIKVQNISEITKQEVLDIVKTNLEVRELFNKGAEIYNLEITQVLPEVQNIWRDTYSQLLNIDSVDFIGLIGSLSLRFGDSNSPHLYFILVNITTSKVLAVYESGVLSGRLSTTIVATP